MQDSDSRQNVPSEAPSKPDASMSFQRARLFVIACILICGIIPLLLYYQFVGRVAGVEPQEAYKLLQEKSAHALLLDVRTEDRFNAGHLEEAVSWPFEDIKNKAALKNPAAKPGPDEMPEQFRGKTLLVISEGGWKSAQAVRLLYSLSPFQHLNVKGGYLEWIGKAGDTTGMADMALVDHLGKRFNLPSRKLTRFELYSAIGSGFVLKTIYMTLSLVLVAVLWRRRSPDLMALRWAMVFFYVGEAFCAGNYLLFNEQSHLFENLHSYGMVIAFAFAVFALFEGIDRRLLFLSEPNAKCAALTLCGPCIKYADVPCGLRRVFQILIPSAFVLCLLPLSAVPHADAFNTTILGKPYGYSHHIYHQLYEIRYLPIVAMVFCAAALGALLFSRENAVTRSKVLFSCGLGALGFSLFRLFLFAPHRHNLVWFSFWEEVTEFLFVVGVCYILWVFRRRLFGAQKVA